jgi:hypothetical protein
VRAEKGMICGGILPGVYLQCDRKVSAGSVWKGGRTAAVTRARRKDGVYSVRGARPYADVRVVSNMEGGADVTVRRRWWENDAETYLVAEYRGK